MKYNELQVVKNKRPTRVGRGIAANQGKTAGRGTKGQNSRTGSSKKPGFEGGSNPLVQRLPKLKGFKSKKPETFEIYTGQIDNLKLKKVDNKVLSDKGLVPSEFVKVKLIVNGSLTSAVEISLQQASKSAIKIVEKNGGKINLVPQVLQTKKISK